MSYNKRNGKKIHTQKYTEYELTIKKMYIKYFIIVNGLAGATWRDPVVSRLI